MKTNRPERIAELAKTVLEATDELNLLLTAVSDEAQRQLSTAQAIADANASAISATTKQTESTDLQEVRLLVSQSNTASFKPQQVAPNLRKLMALSSTLTLQTTWLLDLLPGGVRQKDLKAVCENNIVIGKNGRIEIR